MKKNVTTNDKHLQNNDDRNIKNKNLYFFHKYSFRKFIIKFNN